MGCCSRTTLLPLGWATGRELTLIDCDLQNSPCSVKLVDSCGGQKYSHTRHNYTQALFGAFCYSLNITLLVQNLVFWNVTLRHILRCPRSFPGEPPRVTKQPHTLEERNPRLPRCGNPRTRTHYLLLALKFSVLTSNRRTRMSSHFSPFQSLTPDFFYNMFPLFSSLPLLVSFPSYHPIRFILFYFWFHSCMLHDQPILPFCV
jgi:hypothetical protein